LAYIFCCRHHEFNHFDIGPKAAKFARITQNNSHYAVQSFDVTDFGTNREPTTSY